MKLTKKKVLGLCLAAAVLLTVAGFLAYRYLPSFRRADLNQYYGVEEGGIALFHNEQVCEEKALFQDGRYYLPLDFVAREINCRFYWDEETQGICYVLPEGPFFLFPGESSVTENGVKTELGYVPLFVRDGVRYLALDIVCAYTALEYEAYEEPGRLWLWTCYDTEVSYAVTDGRAAIRTLPAIKAPIVERAGSGERLLLAEESGSWYRVISENGHCGYVKKADLGEPAAAVRTADWFEEQDYRAKSFGEPVVLGWDYVESAAGGLASLQTVVDEMNRLNADSPSDRRGLNVIAPTWFTLTDNAGGFVSRADAAYVETAHANGFAVWALVENINADVDETAIFSSASARAALIDGLMSQAQALGIDGINLDIEALDETNVPHYLQFVRGLSLRCRKAGLFLTVDTYAPMSYNSYHNLEELSKITDYVIIMCYDESWSEPGPNASLAFVQKALDNALAEASPERLIWAVPFYARLWSQNADGSWNRTTVTMKQCGELLAQCEDAQWLEDVGCYYGTVTADGVEGQLWFEETKSMDARVNEIARRGLGGLAGWRLGMEDSGVWDIFDRYLQSGIWAQSEEK